MRRSLTQPFPFPVSDESASRILVPKRGACMLRDPCMWPGAGPQEVGKDIRKWSGRVLLPGRKPAEQHQRDEWIRHLDGLHRRARFYIRKGRLGEQMRVHVHP